MISVVRFIAVAFAAVLAAIPIAKSADTIKIGIIADMSGPGGPRQVVDDLSGAKLAIEDINAAGGVLGRSIELIAEDAREFGTTDAMQANARAAFAKLSAQADIVAFVGPAFSLLNHAMAPQVMEVGKPMMIGGTDPKLTHMGNPWLFRCRPNDTYSTKAMAAFGATTLQRKRWAITHVNDPFGLSARNALTEELKQVGVEPVVIQGIDVNKDSGANIAHFVQAATDARADIIASFLYGGGEASQSTLARQLRQGHGEAIWIGSPTTANPVTLKRAGADLNGAYAVADFATGASPAAEAFSRKYEAAFKSPPSIDSSAAFDAVNLLAKAIANAGGTEPDKIRAALLAIRGYQGAEGTYNFDQNGDGLRGYNILHNENGSWVFVKHVEFPFQ